MGFRYQNQFYLHQKAGNSFKLFLAKNKDRNVKVSMLWDPYFGIYSQKWLNFIKCMGFRYQNQFYLHQKAGNSFKLFLAKNKDRNVKVSMLWDPYFSLYSQKWLNLIKCIGFRYQNQFYLKQKAGYSFKCSLSNLRIQM